MTATLVSHATDPVPAPERAAYWNSVIAEAYFPLRLTFRDAAQFRGRLSMRQVGAVSLSRLETDALAYERGPGQIARQGEEEFLITIPRLAPVEFTQLGREVSCAPGAFLVERGNEPYRFSYGAPNALGLLKVSRALLAERIRQPDRFCAQQFDARGGVGALFVTMARAALDEDVTAGAADLVGRQLVELLALALSEQAETEGLSAVRAAHLRRADAVIRRDLLNPALGPERVARACGISKRYLHEIFAEDGRSVAREIREARLRGAREAVAAPGDLSLAEIAYRFCFSDQAQFSRLFKQAFGMT
ncbi:MAG: helix-turn-helix domain-containing protein, partial [Sphingomonadales bacterium]|nr:helix-turn-helix domain-containing protein [Sphingomonadales bacterium]